jgi:3-oxoacyl-[acyl-carrier protein] reductase
MKLEGKVALITGAEGAWGEPWRCSLPKKADIAVNDINSQDVESTAEEIRKMGRRVIAIKADVSESDEVKQWWKGYQ